MRGIMILLAAMLAGSATAEAAGEAAAGKKKSAMCAACHGKNGIATLPDAPNLAGQKETYLLRSLKAYKTGERQNQQMSMVVQTLSDEDIASLAAYYASIKITVEAP